MAHSVARGVWLLSWIDAGRQFYGIVAREERSVCSAAILIANRLFAPWEVGA